MDAPDLGFRMIDAVVDAVQTSSSARQLVIGVEDIHWADPSSLLALQEIARLTAEVGCLLYEAP